jgi:AraC-like DNA-binding protein
MQTIYAKSIPAAKTETGHDNRSLVDALVNSRTYRDYERAFSSLTGLPIALQPVETWQLPHHGKPNENALCALMSRQNSACAACLQVQERLCRQAATEPQTITCALGLSDTAVPVRMHDRLIGFLQIGQVFRAQPTEEQFDKVVALAEKWEVKADPATLRQAFFSGKVITPQQHNSAIKLLAIFAQHLAALSNQVFIQRENAEPPAIASARAYIDEHQHEDISLSQVARAANMSSFYFCKMFKKAAGITFTNYLARVRIEKSKNLLLNPNLRVSEIAYEVGFQSLTHFNRVFKSLLRQSPTEYREQLLTN